MLAILSVLILITSGLARGDTDQGSIFRLLDSPWRTSSFLHHTSLKNNLSSALTTGTSFVPSLTSNTCEAIQTQLPLASLVVAIVEVRIGSLRGVSEITLSNQPRDKITTRNAISTIENTGILSAPTVERRPCLTCADSASIPPFPANLTNATAFPTASRPLAGPSLQNLPNLSASSTLWSQCNLVSAILVPLTLVALM